MEQLVLVPASVYNKSVTTQSVTKQELPKYKAEQPPVYQIDSLKRDINKKHFGKADSLLDKILSCSRIKLSNSQTIILEDYGYKYIQKLPQFSTTLNSRRNSSIDMRPNTVQNCDFMYILYSELLREYKKHTFNILVIDCESPSMTCFFAKLTGHSLHEKNLKM